MTRQREYQLRNIAKGLCPLCGSKKGKTQLCEEHRLTANRTNSERKKRNGRKAAFNS